jgi:hypothetical protein
MERMEAEVALQFSVSEMARGLIGPQLLEEGVRVGRQQAQVDVHKDFLVILGEVSVFILVEG